ncbi:expressed unknown protein [Ectocarpus siliculosus]|uniref:Uncharacterized protein n=1 Tax=Ectocarpus siliculosus TaxID=2880 RepID=D7FV59_ECTSI|nr:expressed unknown protein [Ectocarpus siliculosus]|eukprot:CBJ31865.1 expressed unknown protein [Ectocarpus siliculosus]
MKALIAFLGARKEHLASLNHVLPSLLGMADSDKDEWVQVVSGLVRQKLLPRDEDDSTSVGDEAKTSQSDFVLRKTVREVLERAKQNMSERAGNGKQRVVGGSTIGGNRDTRRMREAPYFGPLEERYVSRKQQPRKQEFANAHFSVKYDFVGEFSEDLASNVGGTSNTSSSPTGGGASVAAAALASRVGQGGLLKTPGSFAPAPTPAAPNLAQARRVSLAAVVDPSAGSDGLRRTSKPLALSRNYVGLQHGSGRTSSGVGGARGTRGGGGASPGKAGLMMINVDELQAIHAEKQSAREKAKGKPGRKKAKLEGGGEQSTAGMEPGTGASATGTQQVVANATDVGNTDGQLPEGASGEGKKAKPKAPAKPSATADGPMPVPQQGEIEAVAAMMVLGVAGGGEDAETSYLPEALTKLLENANSLRPEGKAKLESFFQKKMPEGSQQERVKYHEEVSPGADGEMMRVTSYIRLDYETWVWDRVHKKKRVKS